VVALESSASFNTNLPTGQTNPARAFP